MRDQLLRKGHSVVYIGSSKGSVLQNAPKVPLAEGQFVKAMAIDLSDWPGWASRPWYQCVLDQQGLPVRESSSNDIAHGIDKKMYHIDMLINCAGITQTKLALHTDANEMARIMNVNFMSSATLTQLAVRQMVRTRNRPLHGCHRAIISIASVLGDTTLVPGTSMYSASKAAMIQHGKVLQRELQRLQIYVHTLTPGLVADTDMITRLEPAVQQQLQSTTPATTVDEITEQLFGLLAQLQRQQQET